MATFDQHDQVVGIQYNADRITIYTQATPRPVAPETLAAATRQLAALPLDTIPDPAPLPPGSRMPLRRNPLFVGREADLHTLATALKGGKTAAIMGLGGMGKTQLASEFVHRYGQFFAGGVFWVSFADPAAVPTEVAACGGLGALGLHPAFHTLPLADQVSLVQAAWQSPLPRLLVFDNCEDEALLAQWRPPHGGCRVLVTSRRAQWDATLGVRALPLGMLQRGESLALLRHHRPDLPADDTDLNAIAAELGDLPLALHLVGSFLARYHHAISPAAYLAQLQQPDVLTHRSLQGGTLSRELSPTGHEQHVARSFALSYDRLDPSDPTDASALALLARAAYFAPGQPIPRALLLATIPWVPETSNADLQAGDASGRLLELGLLEPDVAGAVRLHRLLTVFVRAVTSDAAAQTAVEDVLLAETKRLSSAGYPGPLLLLYPHLRAVTEAAQPREDARTAALATMLGDSLYLIGDYAGAQPAYERALALREQILGLEHLQVGESLHNLATLYHTRGRYAEAEPLYQRALAIRERVLGQEHPDVATSLYNLALLYYTQGRYRAAEPLHQRALALREWALGPQHPQVAESLNFLAAVYSFQARRWWYIKLFTFMIGYFLGAELLFRVGVQVGLVLGLVRRVSMVIGLVCELAWISAGLYFYYRYRWFLWWFPPHSFAKAEPLYQRALGIREQALGPNHLLFAESLNNLAAIYLYQGRKAEAKPMVRRALAIWEQALGPQHPQIALVRKNYARTQPLRQRIRSWLLCKREPG